MVIADDMLALLMKQAREASGKAYCPYSHQKVGAAVLTAEGEVFTGCNVENASYGLTICAERNAIFQCAARGPCKVAVVVIYTPTPNPTPPCGACRQVMAEFAKNDPEVICFCDGPGVLRERLSRLLPASYG